MRCKQSHQAAQVGLAPSNYLRNLNTVTVCIKDVRGSDTSYTTGIARYTASRPVNNLKKCGIASREAQGKEIVKQCLVCQLAALKQIHIP